MTVDEILAEGWYRDRRGRMWEYFTSFGDAGDAWCLADGMFPVLAERMIRLLIERDIHLGECPGMNECRRHPRPHVLLDWEDTGKFLVYEPNGLFFRWIFDTHAEAMDAAHKLAVPSE